MSEKPEKAFIDLRIADKTITFTLYNTDNAELQANFIVEKYNLPNQCKSILINRFLDTQKYLRPLECVSAPQRTLELPSSFHGKGTKASHRTGVFYCSLIEAYNESSTTSFSRLYSFNIEKKAVNSAQNVFERLYANDKDVKMAFNEKYAPKTITERYMSNLIRRLTVYPPKPYEKPVEKEEPEVCPFTPISKKSRLLTSNRSVQAYLDLQIADYNRQKRADILKHARSQKVIDKMLGCVDYDQRLSFLKNQLNDEQNDYNASASISHASATERQYRNSFQPKINATSALIGSCRYNAQRNSKNLNLYEKPSINPTPYLVSKQLDRKQIEKSVIDFVFRHELRD